MLKRLLLTWCLVATVLSLFSQIITAEPAFPTADDAVTITFDATQGTAGLANCGCDVYLHTGVITSNSTGPSDWKYVQTTWGQANPDWQLQPVSGEDNLYTYSIAPSIREYYGVPDGEQILQMAFVFRNADGSLEGKADGGSDIYYDVSSGSGELTTSFANPSEDHLDIALGQTINIIAGASATATLSLYDNGALIAEENDAEALTYLLTAEEAGNHLVEFIADDGTNQDTSSFTYSASLQVAFLNPEATVLLVAEDEEIQVSGTAYIPSSLTLFDNGTPVEMADGTEINYTFTADGATHQIDLQAEYEGETATTTFVYTTPSDIAPLDPPGDFPDGPTFTSDSTLYLQFYAPLKQVVFVLGDFNNWLPGVDYQMNRSTDGNTYWLEIAGLEPGQNYTYQYLVDAELRIADPYSTLVLDPFHDQFIPEVTYPNLPDYPEGKTQGIVSLIQPGAPEYDWQVEDFTAPPKEELVVYELLLRDFIARHDYQTLQDTLDYLERLGVNAIELMPISEFEANNSWGYNPSFHMALDKYYGTRDAFKSFVDECHSRGIAVILDVVYNHAFSQSPLAQLYWDPVAFRPLPNNPWLNVEARHPFNVGYDFNHESEATRNFVDRVMTYWLSEFRVDGFRFDLSKGFTQTNNPNDVGAWGNYDASRIAILKHYADVMWETNPDAYVILEHFADWAEEKELTDHGMLTWGGGGIHNNYLEASMGYNSDLSGAAYTTRGWTNPAIIAYMESHDEERMMYKNLQFGNAAGNYNVKDFATATDRAELAAAFFYTIPGPKMLWQFGELGYQFSINTCEDGVTISDNCRLSPKPIRWDYYDQPNRRELFEVVRSLIYLKTNFEVFNTVDFDLDVDNNANHTKKIQLNHETMDVAVLGNFNVTGEEVLEPFQHTGLWYEYFTGDSLLVTDATAPLPLAPGEYRLYSTVRIEQLPGLLETANEEIVDNYFALRIAPNPNRGSFQLDYSLPEAGRVQLEIYNLLGQSSGIIFSDRQPEGANRVSIDLPLPAGTYFLILRMNGKVEVEKMVVTE